MWACWGYQAKGLDEVVGSTRGLAHRMEGAWYRISLRMSSDLTDQGNTSGGISGNL